MIAWLTILTTNALDEIANVSNSLKYDAITPAIFGQTQVNITKSPVPTKVVEVWNANLKRASSLLIVGPGIQWPAAGRQIVA